MVILAEVRLVNIYIFYIFIMLITTMQVHILYDTVWVILFVVAASLLLYRTAAVPCTFVPFKKYIRVCSSFVGNKLL